MYIYSNTCESTVILLHLRLKLLHYFNNCTSHCKETKLLGKEFMSSVFHCEVRSSKHGRCIFMTTINWECFDRVLHEECTKTESIKSVYSLCGFRRRLFFAEERLQIRCSEIINFLLNFEIFWTYAPGNKGAKGRDVTIIYFPPLRQAVKNLTGHY
jgi:hypothetical protein